jgi:hypothetical protein
VNRQIRKLKKIAESAHRQYIDNAGVLGVGYGYKRVGGKITDDLAVVFWVEKKLPSPHVAAGQELPKVYAGYPTDVEVVRLSGESGEDDTTGLNEGRPVAEFLDWGKIHRLNVVQKGGEPGRPGKLTPGKGKPLPPEFKSPIIEVRDDLFIIEDDASLFYITASNEPVFDYVGAWSYFRSEFGDDYDFIAFYFDDSDDDLPKPSRNRSYPIFRDETDSGYGASGVDNRADWQVSNRLLSYATYRSFNRRTLIHEIGHQWLFFVNYADTPGGHERTHLHQGWIWNPPEQQWVHPGTWPDTDRSPMFYGYYDWVQDVTDPALFHRVAAYDGANPDDAESYRFSPLDQYLMGFLHKEAVESSSTHDPLEYTGTGEYQIICVDVPNGWYDPTVDYDPQPLRTIGVEDVINNEGERIPNHLDSQRVFHMAVIAITYDRAASADFLNRAEERRQIHVETWRQATEGRSVIDASLLRTNVDDLYIRDNTADVGNDFSSGVFWDSPDIFVRNCEDSVNSFLDPNIPNANIHESPLASQDNWLYARISNRSGTPYRNVHINFYIANFNGFSGRDTVAEAIPRTEVIYPVDWHPESLIGTELLTEVPANGTAVAKVCWPQSLIPAADWHPCLLVEVIPLGAEPRGLHHVWHNKKLAQKNITIDYVHGRVCPNPSPPAPYDYYLPFSFGHTLTTSRISQLELVRNLDDPHLSVYLDPGEALGSVYQIDNEFYHFIPENQKKATEKQTGKLHELAKKTSREGLMIHIPAGTDLGLQCGSCEMTAAEGWNVHFCDDTRLMLSCRRPDYAQLGLYPMAGFEFVESNGKSLLKMTDPHNAVFPVSFVDKKEYQMGLQLIGDEKTVSSTVRVRIKQRDEQGHVVGGIDFEARPCLPNEPEPIVV